MNTPQTVSPNRLADIVTMLLVNPDRIGELDTNDKHSEFQRAIAQVVCDFCGGDVEPAAGDEDETVTIRPNDSLPESGGVWRYGTGATASGPCPDAACHVGVLAHNDQALLITARVTRGLEVTTRDYTQRDIVAVDQQYLWNQDVSHVDAALCALAQIYRRAVDTCSWKLMVGQSMSID
ncbi:hypothetical protein [Burkholderia sp. Ac-20365]|uniref:hypothetical protein n=1 Tax=Burkholderia sp. Ac-20365 TaxID=2703897 RepID=UPI00197BCD53|nr:hypothetical protein [Burkholderia sp. Ac-20365]MBN3760912.1 hypothetical protein [Burkholderia sp. Ac-20365]